MKHACVHRKSISRMAWGAYGGQSKQCLPDIKLETSPEKLDKAGPHHAIAVRLSSFYQRLNRVTPARPSGAGQSANFYTFLNYHMTNPILVPASRWSAYRKHAHPRARPESVFQGLSAFSCFSLAIEIRGASHAVLMTNYKQHRGLFDRNGPSGIPALRK